MPFLPNISGEFRLVADPELRFTPSGKAVANFRAVANSRKKDVSGEWVDDKVCWVRVNVWDKMAENVAETLTKGDLVFLSGRMETREYETNEGEKRMSVEVTADNVGPSLRWNHAKIVKSERQSSGGQAGGGQTSSTPPAEDPWTVPQQSDDPPF